MSVQQDITSLRESVSKILEQLDDITSKLQDSSKVKTITKAAVYGSTKNQYDKMETAAKSLLANSQIDKIYFLVEDDIYPNPLPECIETINVKKTHYFNEKHQNYNTRWTWIPLLKLALHDMFPSYEKMLWLDTDTIVLNDISELFYKNMNDYYYAAVPERNIMIEYRYIGVTYPDNTYIVRSYPRLYNENYYNSGCLLCNLDALKNGKGDELIRMVNTEKLMFPDQDAINIACHGSILELPSEYNSAYYTEPSNDPKILHLSGPNKRKQYEDLSNEYKSMTWDEAIRHHERLAVQTRH